MTSLTRVNWTEPVFVDNVAVVEVLRSHAPRQLFAWGDYVISYIAKDAFNNSATCVFELFVSRKFKNTPPRHGVNLTYIRRSVDVQDVY